MMNEIFGIDTTVLAKDKCFYYLVTCSANSEPKCFENSYSAIQFYKECHEKRTINSQPAFEKCLYVSHECRGYTVKTMIDEHKMLNWTEDSWQNEANDYLLHCMSDEIKKGKSSQ